MLYFLAILSGILPALILVGFIYWKDKYQREPWRWIAKAFWFGALSCIPALFIEFSWPELHQPVTESIIGAVYDSFLTVALSEESMKFLFFWLLVRNNPYFDERMDGIVYAACVGLGFAGLENISYLLVCLDDLEDFALVGIFRAFLSVPGHFLYAVFMGYYYSLAVFGPKHLRVRRMIIAFIAPLLFHGIFDCTLLSLDMDPVIEFVATIGFIALSIYMWTVGHKRMHALLAKDNETIFQKTEIKENESSSE